MLSARLMSNRCRFGGKHKFGTTDFLEIHFKPYRIVYQVGKKTVYMHGVLDGRRDMPAEGGLQERPLRETYQ